MLDFSGKMSSESENRFSVFEHTESNAEELSKFRQLRITYTRDFLLSLPNVDGGKELLSGMDSSILSELGEVVCLSLSQASSRDSDVVHANVPLPSALPECHGLLGNSTLRGSQGLASGAPPVPKFEDNSHHLLHKSKEPYRPRCRYKAVDLSRKDAWDLYNDEKLGSSEFLNQKEGQQEKMSRDSFEIIIEGQTKDTNEHGKNRCEKSESQQHSDTEGPAICSKFAHHVPIEDKQLASGICHSEASESVSHGVAEDLTLEPSYSTESRKRLQSTDVSSFIQQSSIGSSASNDVSEECNFPLPMVEDIFPSTIKECGLIGISCEDKNSRHDEDSKNSQHELVWDDFVAKLIDEEDILHIASLLPDEESLITVDDFRIMPEKENNPMLMLEGNPVKADRISPSPPGDISKKLTDLNIGIKDEKSTQPSSEASALWTCHNSQELQAYKKPALYHQAQSDQEKTSFHYSQPVQAHSRSPMKPKTPGYSRFKPSCPSHEPFSAKVLPSTFHQSQAKPHQQQQQAFIPGSIPPYQINRTPPQSAAVTSLPRDQSRYVQLSPNSDLPVNYQSRIQESLGMPNPGFDVYDYGGIYNPTLNTLPNGCKLNAGTGFYSGWP